MGGPRGSASRQDSLGAGRRGEGTPVRGVATNGKKGVATNGKRGVATGGQGTRTSPKAKRSRNMPTGKSKRLSPGDSDGGTYSPPSPYSLPSTPSPPASPSLLPGPASPLHRQSCDPADHAPLTGSGRRRKRKRSRSPQTSQSRLSGSSRLSATPKLRRRLLDVSPSDMDAELGGLGTGYDDEGGDLLDKADEALARLQDNRYHSLDDFYTPGGQLDKGDDSKPSHRNSNQHVHKKSDCQDYLNPDLSDSDLLDSGPLDSELLDSDLFDSDPLSGHSGRHSTARSNLQRHKVSHIHILSRAPAGPHVSVTSSDGDTVYVRLRDDRAGGKPREGFYRRRGLLTVPFAELKASVDEEVSDLTMLRLLMALWLNSENEKADRAIQRSPSDTGRVSQFFGRRRVLQESAEISSFNWIAISHLFFDFLGALASLIIVLLTLFSVAI